MSITSGFSLISITLDNLHTNKLVPLERSFYTTSAGVCCIKIHAEMAEKLQIKTQCFIFHWRHCIHENLFHILSLNIDLFKL